MYLVFSTDVLKMRSTTNFDTENVSNTVEVVKNNFGISIDEDDIFSEIQNLNIIDVDNIIFTQKFSSKYNPELTSSGFEVNIVTTTSSYNEDNARREMVSVLNNMGIDESTFTLYFDNTDSGLVCTVTEHINKYPIFNGKIKAVFSSQNIKMSGSWFLVKTKSVESSDTSIKMADICGVLIDMAALSSSDSSKIPSVVTQIDYGYYVGSYDENVVSKTASAVPCYMIATDIGSKYYYDATNGILLKQED